MRAWDDLERTGARGERFEIADDADAGDVVNAVAMPAGVTLVPGTFRAPRHHPSSEQLCRDFDRLIDKPDAHRRAIAHHRHVSERHCSGSLCERAKRVARSEGIEFDVVELGSDRRWIDGIAQHEIALG